MITVENTSKEASAESDQQGIGKAKHREKDGIANKPIIRTGRVQYCLKGSPKRVKKELGSRVRGHKRPTQMPMLQHLDSPGEIFNKIGQKGMTIPKPNHVDHGDQERGPNRAPLLASTTRSGASSFVSMRSPNQGSLLVPNAYVHQEASSC